MTYLQPWVRKHRCCMHVHAWVAESFDNLRKFLTPRAHRVQRTWRNNNTVVLEVHKRTGAPLPFRPSATRHLKGFTGIPLPGNTAYVVADLLASLGNHEAAEHIIQTQDSLNA